MKTAHLLIAVLVGALGLSSVRAQQTSDKSLPPNIIFFLVDDYDKPETSVYGGNVLTPNLDRLAREGMTFTNAHVTSTVCTPSRYTCLTGRYAGASTSKFYLGECPAGQQGLPAFNVELEEDNMNVGQVLKNHGYATGFVGKYHVGPHIDEGTAEEFGWKYAPKTEEYTESLAKRIRHNQERARQMIRERGFTWVENVYWGNMKAPLKGHNPEWTIDAALRFIDEHKDGPFYLQYSTTLLHGPNGEWFRSLDKPLITGDRILNEPIGIMDRASVMQRIEEAGLTSNEAGYLWMDDSLGMLLDRLDNHKIADNTIVLFLADHGSVNKGSLLKFRGTEVPCVIRWPNGIQAGVNCDELLQNTDFVPTWFDVARIDVPAKYRLDGVSLLPLFNEPETPVRTHVYGEMGPARSIKTKQWNYIALRYTREQIETIETEHRSVKKLLGLSGGVSRAKVRPHAFDVDQLYSLSGEPERTEFLNHANDPAYRKQLRQMRRLLKKELTKFADRPFGEFIPGSNAVDGQDQRHLAPLLKKAVAASK